MDFSVIPIAEQYIEGWRNAVDAVARERRYIAFLEAPPMEMCRAFALDNLRGGWPHFVALVDGAVVGWCDITSKHRPTYAHCGTLGMGVIAAHRGRGIGRALMQAALNAARAKPLTRIELSVNATNERAVALYRSFGFVVEGVRRNAVRTDGVYQDSIEMALLFDS